MRSKTNCFNCKITQNGTELLNQDFITLKDISDATGLTYHQVADISAKRTKLNKYDNFKFFPKIQITRINRQEE